MMSRTNIVQAALLGLCLLLGPVASDAKPLRIKQGMPFTEVRQQIILSRWVPDPARESRDSEPIGVERLLIDQGITEVEFCAIDQALCTFKYRKKKACLQVTTRGEELPDMTVLRWTYHCRPEH
ncbi:Uncharacterised protein [Delftia tsuruhatensis]|uniref:hypothetical protein n=1 Tax=Delftia tsuruhatensis TaxID=180282 RepID=UPI001E7A56C4|nr:hypothetical protein [Delftia tsuruhatensis]CAB5723839.1 Uncharacterised protein [Delftia tsuruhatensis]CAC9685076.1 Uncharacterised protein [Delftia tsuruhatensis]